MAQRELKIDLAHRVIDSGLILIAAYGKEARIDGILGPVERCDIEGLSMLHQTPASENYLASAPYSLDIWFGSGKGRSPKVFSAYWNVMPKLNVRVVDLVRLDRGPWLPSILTLAQTTTDRPRKP